MTRMTLNCKNCGLGYDLKFHPALGIEVIKHNCANCELGHTIIIRVDVETEERRAA